MEHSKECKDILSKFLKEDAEYVIQWPNHCKTCGGWGIFYTDYDPSPAGISLSAGYMTDFDPCNDCVENDTCPRCGRLLPDDFDYDDFDEPCPHCEFTFDGKTDGRAEAPQCFCYQLLL